MLLLLFIAALTSCSYIEPGKNPNASHFRVAWTKNLDPVYSAGNLPIGTNSPTVANHMIFLGTLSGQMRAYDLESGAVVWEKDEKKTLGAKAVRFKDQVIYGSYFGRVFSRNFLTGELRYAIDLGAPVEAPPLIYQERAIFHLRNHQVICMDANTGKLLWSYKRSVPFTTTLQGVSVPVAKGSKVYVGFADGHVSAISLEEGVVVWEQKISLGQKFIDVDVKPLIFNEQLIVGSAAGKLKFLDLANGLTKAEVDVTIGHRPAVIGNKLYVGSVDGLLVEISSEGKLLRDHKLSQRGISSVKAWNNILMVSSHDGKINFVDPQTLMVKDDFLLGSDQSTVFGKIEAGKDFAAVYSSRNRLYVFRKI